MMDDNNPSPGLRIRCLCIQAWTKNSLTRYHSSPSSLKGIEAINHTLGAIAYLMQVSK